MRDRPPVRRAVVHAEGGRRGGSRERGLETFATHT